LIREVSSPKLIEGRAMKFPRRQFLHLAAGGAAPPAVSRIARAQTYRTRPVTLIVPYPAGGGVDTMAALLRKNSRVLSVNRSSLRTARAQAV
jgi:hypothetical protein